MSTDLNVEQIYKSVVEVADYTIKALYKFSVHELAEVNPSFDIIAEMCENFVTILHAKDHNDLHVATEVMEIMQSIASAIHAEDNNTLVDCTCHLEEFLRINVRK